MSRVELIDITKRYGSTLAVDRFNADIAEGEFITRDIGDHETLAPKDVPLTSTAFYWLNHDLMWRMAKILGKDEDAERHAKRASAIKDAFNGRFLDRATGKPGVSSFRFRVPSFQLERFGSGLRIQNSSANSKRETRSPKPET